MNPDKPILLEFVQLVKVYLFTEICTGLTPGNIQNMLHDMVTLMEKSSGVFITLKSFLYLNNKLIVTLPHTPSIHTLIS